MSLAAHADGLVTIEYDEFPHVAQDDVVELPTYGQCEVMWLQQQGPKPWRKFVTYKPLQWSDPVA